jgi:hypothetical protein
MEFNDEQQDFYRQTRERCRAEVEAMNRTILQEWQQLNDEVKRVQEHIQALEIRKRTVAQMYASASALLGLESDLDVSPAIKDGDGDTAEELGVGEIDL